MQRAELIFELHGIIFSAVLMIYLGINNRKEKQRDIRAMHIVLGLNALNLLGDMGDIYFHQKLTAVAFAMMDISNFAIYLFQMLLNLGMAFYVYELLRKTDPNLKKNWLRAAQILTAIDIALLFINPCTHWLYYIDSTNTYYRGSLFMVSIILALFVAFITMIAAAVHWKMLDVSKRYVLFFYYLFPVIGILIQLPFFGYSFLNIGITISIIILATEVTIKNTKKQREQEIALLQSRAYLLNSQIKPHFMFNTLSVIQGLIEEDPETASDAIGYFSKFLRKGMNFRVEDGPIPIREELEYTKNYLYLQKLRFEDKLNIVYDIQENINFNIPFLTIQPLAENAVRHGIRGKKSGGTLTIKIRQTATHALIEIKDDGAGFDTESINEELQRKIQSSAEDGKNGEISNGIGMKNVEERLKIMVNGSMEVASAPGKGTSVLIIIPIRLNSLSEMIPSRPSEH